MLIFVIIYTLSIPDFQNISLPTEMTNCQLRKFLSKKVILGTYRVGNLMAPLTYIQKKFKHDNIVGEEVTICGREISIFDVRKMCCNLSFNI